MVEIAAMKKVRNMQEAMMPNHAVARGIAATGSGNKGIVEIQCGL
jgi:hypothetical protein